MRQQNVLAVLTISLGIALGASPSTQAEAAADAVMLSVEPIHFGDVDRPGSFAGTAVISARAPLGMRFRIALNGGLYSSGGLRHVRRQGGSELIPYQLYQDANCTQPWGDADLDGTFPQGTSLSAEGTGGEQRTVIFGRLLVQAPPQPGLYQDSVLVTIYY